VRRAFIDIGLATPRTLDRVVGNLGVYNYFLEFREREPEIYRLYHEKQETIKEIKRFYRMSNLRLVESLKEQLKMARDRFPLVTMARMLRYPVVTQKRRLDEMDEDHRLYHYQCRELQHSMDLIRDTDEHLIKTCRLVEASFFRRTCLQNNPTWKAMRAELEENIRNSNSIFIFGGHTAVLHNRLNFFRLQRAFRRALSEGTNFYTISAGSIVLCSKIILYDDAARHEGRPPREYEFFDNGFGLVSKLILFPHCRDRIAMDDPDNLAYLAQRFRGALCVGLDEESFLLLDTYRKGKQEYERFASVGPHDGVYLFDASGEKVIMQAGHELILPGTRPHHELRAGGKGRSAAEPARRRRKLHPLVAPISHPIYLPPLPGGHQG